MDDGDASVVEDFVAAVDEGNVVVEVVVLAGAVADINGSAALEAVTAVQNAASVDIGDPGEVVNVTGVGFVGVVETNRVTVGAAPLNGVTVIIVDGLRSHATAEGALGEVLDHDLEPVRRQDDVIVEPGHKLAGAGDNGGVETGRATGVDGETNGVEAKRVGRGKFAEVIRGSVGRGIVRNINLDSVGRVLRGGEAFEAAPEERKRIPRNQAAVDGREF